jgi:plastocyanin
MIHRIAFTIAAAAVCTWTGAISDAGRARAQTAAGSIEGRVTFEGPPPRGTPVVESGGTQPTLHLDAAGGLQYTVVYLPDGRLSAASTPGTARTMDQRRFVFEPQVLAVRAGQSVRFTNSDPAGHNVRSRGPGPANVFSINTAPGAAAAHSRQFPTPTDGRPAELSCDIHPWMQAWIYVFDHDQFAVTEAGGRFRFDDVPAGRHRVAVRQPAGRLERDLAVDVRAGGTSHLDVRFTPADVGMPAR